MERRTDEQADAEHAAEVHAEGESRTDASVSSVRFDRGRVFRVAAWLLFAAASVLIYLGRTEAAFLVAALGATAWFLGVRTTLIRKHDLVKVGGRNWRPRREVEENAGEDLED